MFDRERRQADAHARQVHGAGGVFIAMELTRLQLDFLVDLRTAACRVVAGLDAGVIGPLIRANLVRWDDDPAAAAKRRDPPAPPSLRGAIPSDKRANTLTSCTARTHV